MLVSLQEQENDTAVASQNGLHEEDEEGGAAGYSAAYARLHNAAYIEPDPSPNIQDTSKYLIASIGKYSQVKTVVLLP